MNASAKSRSLWPYFIIAYFVIFGSALATWIIYAFHEDMDLVRNDYYQEEILYQQQLDRLNRTQPFRAEVRITHDKSLQAITITLPAAHTQHLVMGCIQLYRPSDAKLDRSVPLSVDSSGTQRIDAKRLRPGFWKVRVTWTAGGQEYFFDQPLVVAAM